MQAAVISRLFHKKRNQQKLADIWCFWTRSIELRRFWWMCLVTCFYETDTSVLFLFAVCKITSTWEEAINNRRRDVNWSDKLRNKESYYAYSVSATWYLLALSSYELCRAIIYKLKKTVFATLILTSQLIKTQKYNFWLKMMPPENRKVLSTISKHFRFRIDAFTSVHK